MGLSGEIPPTLHVGSFGQDEALELYVTDHEAGRVLKIVPASH